MKVVNCLTSLLSKIQFLMKEDWLHNSYWVEICSQIYDVSLCMKVVNCLTFLLSKIPFLLKEDWLHNSYWAEICSQIYDVSFCMKVVNCLTSLLSKYHSYRKTIGCTIHIGLKYVHRSTM